MEYRALTISAGTFAVICCGYYLTRKLERLFSATFNRKKARLRAQSTENCGRQYSRQYFLQRIPKGGIYCEQGVRQTYHGLRNHPNPFYWGNPLRSVPRSVRLRCTPADLEVMRAAKFFEASGRRFKSGRNVRWIFMSSSFEPTNIRNRWNCGSQ